MTLILNFEILILKSVTDQLSMFSVLLQINHSLLHIIGRTQHQYYTAICTDVKQNILFNINILFNTDAKQNIL